MKGFQSMEFAHQDADMITAKKLWGPIVSTRFFEPF